MELIRNLEWLLGLSLPGAGLLGLAGRWGHQTRFWLPAALAWAGSGSLAAFDGLELMLNQLMSGTGASGPGWILADTVVVIEVVIGMLCGAVGALAVIAAARDDQKPAGTKRTGTQTKQFHRQQEKIDGGPRTGPVGAIAQPGRPAPDATETARSPQRPGGPDAITRGARQNRG